MILTPLFRAIDSSGTRKHTVSLRVLLTRLIWLCVLPLVLLATYLAVREVLALKVQRDAEAEHLVRNLATAIDRQLQEQISALELLAALASGGRSGPIEFVLQRSKSLSGKLRWSCRACGHVNANAFFHPRTIRNTPAEAAAAKRLRCRTSSNRHWQARCGRYVHWKSRKGVARSKWRCRSSEMARQSFSYSAS